MLGEWQTRELLGLAGGDRREAAAGWGGDRYELFRRDPGRACDTPCRERDVLLVRWRWDTAADAREFEAALREWAEEGVGGRPAGEGMWTVGDGVALIVPRDGTVALALAPDPASARLAVG